MKIISDYGAQCIGEGIAFGAFAIAVAISGFKFPWFFVILWGICWGPRERIRDTKLFKKDNNE